MRAALKGTIAVSVMLLVLPSVAAADTSVSLTGFGNLNVQANATGSHITITRTGATTFTVSDPAGNVTGTGPNCTPAGPTVTVTCQNVVISSFTQSIFATGQDGADTITLAPGFDVRASLVGGNGNDVLTGGTQDDTLEGGNGNDILNGEAGNDKILPGFGSDHVDGGGGNDYAEQQSQVDDADVLGGGADDDIMWSQGSGTAQYNGGPGDDLFMHSGFNGPVAIEMFGGEGEDEASLGNNADDPIAVSLDDQPNDGAVSGGTSNVHSDVENLDTGSGGDVIAGSAGPNIIRSDASRFNQFLQDTPPGNDTIDPGGGVDYVFSGAGDDRITSTDLLGDTINCGTNPAAPGDSDTVTGDAIDVFFACENVTAIPLPVLDTTHPRVTVIARSISRRAFARKGLTIKLKADEPASFGVDLNAKVKRRRGGTLAFQAAVGEAAIGTGRLKLGTGTRSLRLKPSKKFAGSVRNRRLRLVIRVTAKDAAGNVARAAKSVRVK